MDSTQLNVPESKRLNVPEFEERRERFRELMAYLGCSQAAFCEQNHFSEPQIWRWMRRGDPRQPPKNGGKATSSLTIAQAAGVAIEYLHVGGPRLKDLVKRDVAQPFKSITLPATDVPMAYQVDVSVGEVRTSGQGKLMGFPSEAKARKKAREILKEDPSAKVKISRNGAEIAELGPTKPKLDLKSPVLGKVHRANGEKTVCGRQTSDVITGPLSMVDCKACSQPDAQ